MARIVTLLASLHMYFSKVFKTSFGALETCRFNCLSLTVPKNILQNAKTRQISLLSPLKHILSEHHTLLVKMYLDSIC